MATARRIQLHDRCVIDRFATRLWAVEGGQVRAYADRAGGDRRGRQIRGGLLAYGA